MADDLLQTPFREAHLKQGGRLVPFAGWEMPVQFAGIIPEHNAVRDAVGVFDISHMGQFYVSGSDSVTWLNGLLTNDLAVLADGEGQYSLMLNESGGVIDDLIVYRVASDLLFLVVNASRRQQDLAWLAGHLPGDGSVSISDVSDAMAAVAVQGPKSQEVYRAIQDDLQFPELPERNGIAIAGESGEARVVCRTGYTGEDGYELFFPTPTAGESYARILQAVIDAGGQPCGLGARDTLRLEMGFPLNGSDLSEERTPLQAGLGFFCKLDKLAGFIGHDILTAQKANGLGERLVGIQMIGKTPPPRPHYPVLLDGETIGELCSAGLSPTLGAGIGMAYLPTKHAKRETKVEIEIRGRAFPAEIVRKPFVKIS